MWYFCKNNFGLSYLWENSFLFLYYFKLKTNAKFSFNFSIYSHKNDYIYIKGNDLIKFRKPGSIELRDVIK